VRAGRLQAAEENFRAALAIDRAAFGRESPAIARDLHYLGNCLQQQERYGEALAALEEALELRTAALGADHPETGDTVLGLGRLRQARGELAAAEALLRRFLAIRRAVEPDHWLTSTALTHLAEVVLGLGRREEALALADEALAIARGALPEGHWRIALAGAVRGEVLAQLGLRQEAERELRANLGALLAAHPEGSAYRRDALQRLARVTDGHTAIGEADELSSTHDP
jgi:tetratricopeptide (TPR) repeat protein